MTATDIKRIACSHFGVTTEQLEGPRGDNSVVWSRHCAIAACLRHVRCSYKGIGAEFGGRHHTSVIHARRTVEDMCLTSPSHCRQFESFIAKVQALNSKPGRPAFATARLDAVSVSGHPPNA
jgi:chromosomal replication initiator protein